MKQAEIYKQFEISWQEPPHTTAGWVGNVASEHPHLYALMRRNGSQVIEGRTRDEMIANARRYIDGLTG